MAEIIRLTSTLTDQYVNGLKGQYLDDRHYETLIGEEDVDVLKPDGSPLLIFRRGVLPAAVCRAAYPALRRAARATTNRGIAAGGHRTRRRKRDGTLGRTTYAAKVESGIIGFFDRNARFPFCRTTAYTSQEVAGWRRVLPFVRAVNDVFKRECPDRYEAQAAVVRRTPKEWVIPGTVFTTVTVNRNYRSAVHKDAGDLKQGFGVMSVLRAGEYEGGHLIFPKFQIAVDMRTRDVLLADVHEWHGNAPLVGVEGEYERVSTVLYYRSKMRHCGTPAEELDRAKRRRRGERLYP